MGLFDQALSWDVRDLGLLHPRKRRNTERGPKAGVRGASPGVWVRRTGGDMYAYTEGGLSVYRGGSSPYSHSVCVSVCLSVVRRILNCILYRRYLNCIVI